jgi:hypothetical protein
MIAVYFLNNYLLQLFQYSPLNSDMITYIKTYLNI